MYLWDLPFFVIGILFLFRQRLGKWWLLPLWLLIGIIPAAVARETPHALRIESSLPTWQIITAYGFVVTVYSFKKYRKAFVGFAMLILSLFVVYFLHGYFLYYPKAYAQEWQYGYKNVIDYIAANQNQYDQIYISDRLERGYIYTLFYLKYNPRQFREEAKIRGNDFGFVHVDNFNKYTFEFDQKKQKTPRKNALYLVGPDQVPANAEVIQRFYSLNDNLILVAYTGKR